MVYGSQSENLLYVMSERRALLPLSFSPPPGATQPIVGVYITALYRALAS
jgi:hypothetical protein